MDDDHGAKRKVVPLGRATEQRWPCVGDPDTWDAAGTWFNCGGLGKVSLLALMPGGSIMEPVPGTCEDEPVMVHLTVCPKHAQAARRWLRLRMHPEDDVLTAGTELVLRQWGQIVDPVQVPVFSPTRAARTA
jgi:hypothetical protein